MTATIDRMPTSERSTSPPARLSVTPEGSAPGLLDGAWWPRSRDLLHELPALIDVLDTRWGRITRVTVNPTYWPVIPRKVPVAGHTVHVGWFAGEQDPHKLLLLSYTAGRWDLLVIPPETDAATAARLMAAAATPGSPLTASALMTNEDTSREAQESLDREEEWETEGGHATAAAESPNPPGYMSCAGGM
ncbi:DUF5994 family protein [Streptomyces wuyuanensis]|uniref:Uncharacterized protein n=1 Tax=Streptomyces wuyuanensis TaxID=1196353 RepID=A0A1H0AHF8_9ACTN|nr:DUF5994 family protein [Streptomyces wuyuanensis]SDN32493.1 hypothetical protein SAMN05444921_12449 [Streptomyces wuyuanensis]